MPASLTKVNDDMTDASFHWHIDIDMDMKDAKSTAACPAPCPPSQSMHAFTKHAPEKLGAFPLVAHAAEKVSLA